MSRPYRAPRITPDEQQPSRFGAFKGLVNTASRKDIGLESLYVADNVLLSNTNKLVRRPGYQARNNSGAVRGGFTIVNDVYIDIGGSLYRKLGDNTLRQVVSALTNNQYDAAEVNNVGYFTNGTESGTVRGDIYSPFRIEAPVVTSGSMGPMIARVGMGRTYDKALYRVCATYETADGREGPVSAVVDMRGSPLGGKLIVSCEPAYAKTHIYITTPDGAQFRRATTTVASVTSITTSDVPGLSGKVLDYTGTYPAPEAFDTIAYYAGRMYVSQYIAAVNQSVVWVSMPSAFHLFRYGEDYHMVPGQVVWMDEIHTGLLIGTTTHVLEIKDDTLVTHADYGMVPGTAGDVDSEGMAYVWTTRGLCSVSPWKNLTEDDVSMAAGTSVACKFVYFNGMKQFLTVTQGGGTPFNRREERA